MNRLPAPLFRDPIYDGAADPTIIWNHEENSWWILYTNRRANVPCRGLAWVHGTDIGIASSLDGGATWLYRGIVPGLEFERGRNTFWAPEVIFHDGTYHMFISYITGIPHDWSGGRHIVHMTSKNLWDWKFRQRLVLSSDHVIDACVAQIPSGRWRMWYKDEANQSHTYLAESDNLSDWTVIGPMITDRAHEGPNVFYFGGYYWMVTDTWKGQAVYRSEDAERWVYNTTILDKPGTRPDDGTVGHHGDVLVKDDRAYIFYFTHPDRKQGEHFGANVDHPYYDKRTSLQAAELTIINDQIVCERNNTSVWSL